MQHRYRNLAYFLEIGESSTFGEYKAALDAAGALTYGKFGDADVTVCDARKLFDTVYPLMH